MTSNYLVARVHKHDWARAKMPLFTYMQSVMKEAERETDNERADSLYDTYAGLSGLYISLDKATPDTMSADEYVTSLAA